MVFVQDTNNFYHCEELFLNNALSLLFLYPETSHHPAFLKLVNANAGFR